MNINFQYKEFNQDNLSIWIFQQLSAFFASAATTYDIEFDFSGKTFSNEISFVELFSTESKGYEWVRNSDYFSRITDVLCGIKVENEKTDKKPIYRLSFIFDKATFDSYPSFDELRCYKLSFLNTIFKKGARFRHIDVDEVLFEPRELSSDATFFHRKKADIENGILRGEYKGRIGKFQYRHQLEGDGTTFLIGMRFTEQAKFTDCVLNKVQFSFIDEDSMSKCFFANSMLEDAKFYNCNFRFKPNAKTSLLLKDFFIYTFFLMVIIVIIATFLLSVDKGNSIKSIVISVEAIGMLILFIIAFNMAIFMPLMSFFTWCFGWLFEKMNSHISVGDDIVIDKPTDLHIRRGNYDTVREVYRQLKVNFEGHGDYQTAGEFYYSQRYYELVNFSRNISGTSGQAVLLSMHHWINGFGERWFRAFVWFLLTIVCTGIFINPNKDYVASANTPDFLIAHFDKQQILKLEQNNSEYYMVTAEVNNSSGNSTRPIISEKVMFVQDNNTTKKQVVKLEDATARLVFAMDRMSAPLRFGSQNSWFEVRTKAGHYGGMLSTVLLWIFFLAFISAVKNRIRR